MGKQERSSLHLIIDVQSIQLRLWIENLAIIQTAISFLPMGSSLWRWNAVTVWVSDPLVLAYWPVNHCNHNTMVMEPNDINQ